MNIREEILKDSYNLNNEEIKLFNHLLFKSFEKDLKENSKEDLIILYKNLCNEEFERIFPLVNKLYLKEAIVAPETAAAVSTIARLAGKSKGIFTIIRDVFKSFTMSDWIRNGWTIFSAFSLIRAIISMFRKQEPEMPKKELTDEVKSEVERIMKEREEKAAVV